jgi:homoserine trans-succinylase
MSEEDFAAFLEKQRLYLLRVEREYTDRCMAHLEIAPDGVLRVEREAHKACRDERQLKIEMFVEAHQEFLVQLDNREELRKEREAASVEVPEDDKPKGDKSKDKPKDKPAPAGGR